MPESPEIGSGTVLAHGIGGVQDLPLPLSYVVAGAGIVLFATFVLLGVLWRTPRLRGDDAGVVLPRLTRALDSRWARWGGRITGLVVAGYVLIAALFGADLATNPVFGVVYVLLWAGLLPTSVLLGHWYRRLNPVRTLHLVVATLLRMPRDRGLAELPARVGYWPAVAGLVAFVWLELIVADRDTLTVIRAFFALYVLAHLVAAAVYGERWFDHGEAFEAAGEAWSRLSPWGRRPDGLVAFRTPLDTAAGWSPAPGLWAVATVLLGATGFDAFSGSRAWEEVVVHSPLPATLTGTLGLLLVLALVAGAYRGAVALSGRLARTSTADLPGQFAHSLVPIAAGYFVAHYFTFFVLEGQRTLFQLSDPLVNGGDWLGFADGAVRGAWVTPVLVANLQVIAIVLGHLGGVVLAHDRAVRLFPSATVVRSQLPLLVLMVAYTVGGLVLLFPV